MFNVGGGEILVILLLALLVLGPDKLPEYARKAGRYMNEFRRMTSGFQEEFRQAMDLSEKDSSPAAGAASATAPAAAGDALERATEGPRLVAQPEPAAPAPAPETVAEAPVPDPTPVVPAAPPAPVVPPAPAYGGAFAADVTPATAPGPEVTGPTSPTGSDHGGTGSTSAA